MDSSSRPEARPKRTDGVVCNQCGETRQDSEFPKRNKTKTKTNTWCKFCQKEYRRWWKISRKYGLAKEDYMKIMESQKGQCGICRGTLDAARAKAPVVDHCHKTGRVRGILCKLCNMAIGGMKDSPMRLRAAAVYLESQGTAPYEIVETARQRVAERPWLYDEKGYKISGM